MAMQPPVPLQDVIAPTQVSWWPLSPFAYMLIIVTIVLIAFIIRFIVKRWRFNQAKRHAKTLALAITHAEVTQLNQLHEILKRLARHYYGDKVSALHGERWSKFVMQVSGTLLTPDDLALLYAPSSQAHPQCRQKLVQAIVKFKLKEQVNV